jgi:hypothetical protein
MLFGYQKVEEITENLHGLYIIDHEKYHAGPGLSSTKVKKALGSPEEYFHQEDTDTAALKFGRAFHAFTLEPDVWQNEFVVQEMFPGHPNSNLYKEAKAEWIANVAQGRQIVSQEDFKTINLMADEVHNHPDFDHSKFTAEVMAIAKCPRTGLLLKCKSDMFSGDIVDIKSTSGKVTPHGFINDIVKYNYHVSAAFYVDVTEMASGIRPKFFLMPVSKKAPFICERYQIGEDLLHEGRLLYQAALDRIKKWNGKIPNYKKTHIINANNWVRSKSKDIISYLETVG